MTSGVQLAAILVSLTLLVVVLDLVRRRKLSEEYSVVWIVCAAALLVLSIWRDSLHVVAGWLGVFYPPIILVMMLILIVFAASLWFSVIVSKQRQQIERLIEDTAVLAAELRDLKAHEEDREPWAALDQEESRPAPKRPSA